MVATSSTHHSQRSIQLSISSITQPFRNRYAISHLHHNPSAQRRCLQNPIPFQYFPFVSHLAPFPVNPRNVFFWFLGFGPQRHCKTARNAVTLVIHLGTVKRILEVLARTWLTVSGVYDELLFDFIVELRSLLVPHFLFIPKFPRLPHFHFWECVRIMYSIEKFNAVRRIIM
jgi:hypothetical protein